MGDPQRTYPILHVGGTNGKGSVAAALASVLRAQGLRVGLYTSPHLVSFRERIQIDGLPAEEDLLQRCADRLRPALEQEGFTFFEAGTVLAFTAFREAGVQAAVVEVGLGGRLDSTNVVDPVVTGITNVAMDHAEYLGDTRVKIAGEKAGILKAGVPAFTADVEPETLEVFSRRAGEVGAPLTILPADEPRDVEVGWDHTDFTLDGTVWGRLHLRTPLPGVHQARNAALAVRMLEALPPDLRPSREAVLQGIRSTRWPGRVQVVRRPGAETWIFDVAHNVAGVGALAETLGRVAPPRPLVLLVGILGDKDWAAMLPALFREADYAVLTQPPSAPPARRWDPEAAAREAGLTTPRAIVQDFSRAVEAAREQARGGTVVVTGSVHTVGDALLTLGIEPFPRNP